jgi:hypothetical protein
MMPEMRIFGVEGDKSGFSGCRKGDNTVYESRGSRRRAVGHFDGDQRDGRPQGIAKDRNSAEKLHEFLASGRVVP